MTEPTRKPAKRRTSKRGSKSKPAKPAKPLTWDRLAVELGIHIRKLHHLRAEPGAPGDGQSRDPAEWREWIDQRVRGRFSPEGMPGACKYDALVAEGRISWDDALKREKAMEQEIISERRMLELRHQRRELMTLADHRTEMDDLAAAFADVVSACPAALLELVPADRRRDALVRWREVVRGWRQSLAEHA